MYISPTQVRSTCSMALVVCVSLMAFSSLCDCQGLTPAEKANIQNGVNFGIAMADSLKSSDFQHTLITVAKSIGPYIGTIAPGVSLVLGFIPTESAELAMLKRMDKRINDRFDNVDRNFDEVKKLIQNSKFSINFGDIEQNIIAIDYEYKQINNFDKIKKFVENYNTNYDNSGTKLYDALVSTDRSYILNIADEAKKHFDYDRKKTKNFLIANLRLLTKAINLEIAAEVAAEVVAQTHNRTTHKEKVWEKRMKQVVEKCSSIDKEIVNSYLINSTSFAIKFAHSSTNEIYSHNDFAEKLQDLLKAKFYWRDWLVVVYSPIRGFKYHAVYARGGHALFRQNGRNIVTSSIDENAYTPNRGRSSMDTVDVKKSNWWTSSFRDAKDVYLDLDWWNVWASGVIRKGDVGYAHDGQRGFKNVLKTYRDGSPRQTYLVHYNMYMWG